MLVVCARIWGQGGWGWGSGTDEVAGRQFGGGAEVLRGVRERLLECRVPGCDFDDADEVQSLSERLRGIAGGGADERDYGDTCVVGEAGDAGDDFAVGGLAIEAAFAGEAKVAIAQLIEKADFLGDLGESGFDFGAEGRDERGGEPAGGSGARDVARVDAEFAEQNGGPLFESVSELFNVAGIGAFLGREDGGCTAWTDQGIIDVGQHGDLRLRHVGGGA